MMGFQELCLLCYETPGVRHSEAARVTLTSYVDLRVFRMLLRWKFSNLNFESKKVCRSIWRDLAVNLQYFLCVISQVKYCYKASFGPYIVVRIANRNLVFFFILRFYDSF